MRIYANGNVVEVRDYEKAWEVESGQLTMNFSIQELAANVADLARSAAGGEEKALEDLDSDEWYNLGLDLEELDPIQAPDAYREAIRLDPFNADAHVNLGRLYQLSGDLKGATRHYQLALATRPEHQLANYNLGTIFDEQDDCERARNVLPQSNYGAGCSLQSTSPEFTSWLAMRLTRGVTCGCITRLIDQDGV